MSKSPRFINFTELSDELRHFVEAGAKIFPIDTFESLPNEKVYEFYRILSGSHKNEIYGWSEIDNVYVLIGADDRDIRWDDVQFKPNAFTPSIHNHVISEITDFPVDMPPSIHTHTESEITDLDKYTKSEVDIALNAKADTSHTHTEIDIVDLDKYTKSEVDSALNSKVDNVSGKGLSTNDFTDVDKSKLDSLTENATLDYTSMQEALNNHKASSDHDGRYYTESEADVLLSAKADNSTVNGHINSTTIHVTQNDKDTWNTVSNKVDNSRVLTDVPIGAKFTDTLTTINDKTGAIAKADIVALGIPAQDTIYNHPVNHPASIITQDSSNRFVTDVEKNKWNGKADVSDIPISLSELTNDSGFITIDEVPQGIEIVQAVPTVTKAGQIIFLEVV